MKKISLLFVLSILSIQLSTAQNQPTETDPKKKNLPATKLPGTNGFLDLVLIRLTTQEHNLKTLATAIIGPLEKFLFMGV